MARVLGRAWVGSSDLRFTNLRAHRIRAENLRRVMRGQVYLGVRTLFLFGMAGPGAVSVTLLGCQHGQAMEGHHISGRGAGEWGA